MALWCPYLRLWFHLEICPVEQLAACAKSLFVLPGADRWDSQWEWSYALADSACAPGMGSEEVVGEEQFLAQWTAQIRRRWAHQQGSQGRCSPVPAASKQPLQSLPQVSVDVTQTASCSPKPTPTLSAGTCKWVLSSPLLQLWQERSTQPGTEYAASFWSAPVLSVLQSGGKKISIFFYKAVKSTFSGENIASLPAVCCSLVQYSSNLFALGQYFCSVGTVHGSRWNLHVAWKVVLHLSCSSLRDPAVHPQQCPHRGAEGWGGTSILLLQWACLLV